MTTTQKIVLVALLVLGAICLIVGFSLMHYIGGFMRTVEEEAREQERRGADGVDSSSSDPKTSQQQSGETL